MRERSSAVLPIIAASRFERQIRARAARGPALANSIARTACLLASNATGLVLNKLAHSSKSNTGTGTVRLADGCGVDAG